MSVQASLSVYPPSNDQDEGWDRNNTTFILNRVSLCVFFAAISIILFNWARVVDVAEYMTPILNNNLHKIFIGLNVMVTLSIVITIVAYMSEKTSLREGNPVYDSGVLLLAVFNFVFMVAFTIYGIRLYLLTSEITKHKMLKVLFLAGVFFDLFCSSCRFIDVSTYYWKKDVQSSFLYLMLFYSRADPHRRPNWFSVQSHVSSC